ncbi:hypothetical protein TSAR_000592 [Trichomalopsis sarcophagae]|uniref:Uncharacterized protein n=1 Tax=Trichomalopsis sarcophagae TaxID=543379 RepID=A0A232EF04_9HYME|nr:hypothetical protein TSAR_000592 [Trichomalopsis sarcophagae]
MRIVIRGFSRSQNANIVTATLPEVPGVQTDLAVVIFVFNDLENPPSNDFRPNIRRSYFKPWAPGTLKAVADAIFVFSDPKNSRLTSFESLCYNFSRCSCGLPWTPGTSGVVADAIFVFSDPKNSRVAKLDLFSSIFTEL